MKIIAWALEMSGTDQHRQVPEGLRIGIGGVRRGPEGPGLESEGSGGVVEYVGDMCGGA